MTGGSFTILRVRGIPIRVHWSLLLFLPYLAWVFSTQFARIVRLADVSLRAITLPPIFWGAALAVGLFASVALHELAHTLVAVRLGGRVRDITLMLLGGVSRIERMPRTAAREALMAAVGPATSLALAAILFAAHAAAGHGAADLRMALFYLASMNLTLGVFNLLPAFPMDGGRIFRAALTRPFGRARATAIAAAVGKVGAVLFALLGLAMGNLLLVLIAAFLYAGAGAEAAIEQVRASLAGRRVGDLMLPAPPIVGADGTLLDAVRAMRERGGRVAVVVGGAGEPLGLLDAADLADTSPALRGRVQVRELGDRLAGRAVLATPDEPALDALDRAEQAGTSWILVVDGAPERSLVGLLDRERVGEALLLHALASGDEIRARRPRRRLLGPPRPREA